MASDHGYLVQLHDGTWLDTRYRFKPGESVRITSDEHAGKVGKVETRSAHWMEGHTIHQEPGYHLVMENGAWVDAGWWMVESA